MKLHESRVTQVPAPPPGTLGKSELYALSIGQVIGAGVITLIGPAITLTGQSAWLAYGAAIILGFLLIMPVVLLTGTLRLGGGFYSMLAGVAGEKIAGMYAVAFLTQCISLSLFGVSLGVYANSLWPALNPQITGIVFLTIFYVINLGGVDIMAKAQKLMTWLLIAALMMFVVMGMFQLRNPVFDIEAPDFFAHGMSGFMAAMYLFVYSTNGYAMTMNYGRDAKNAKRDIPWAILVSVPTLIVIYCGVAIVGSGVLPLSAVAGKPLTLPAHAVLPPVLFVIFIIGGPIMALMTTINSTMAYNCIPIAQSCKDGWLPRSFAATNRRGAYWKILTFVYVVGLVPIILDFNITTITKNIMLLNAVLSFLYSYAYYRIPGRFPEAWKRSRYHMPNGLYYTVITVSLLAYVSVFVDSVRTLTTPIVVTSIGAMAICMIYAFRRSRSPDVRVETSVWDDD